jgi:hypothetical protein
VHTHREIGPYVGSFILRIPPFWIWNGKWITNWKLLMVVQIWIFQLGWYGHGVMGLKQADWFNYLIIIYIMMR